MERISRGKSVKITHFQALIASNFLFYNFIIHNMSNLTEKTGNLIYIDESGDPGFKTINGASRYFVIAMVIFEENSSAYKIKQKFDGYRKLLGWQQSSELKFSKLSYQRRLLLLDQITDCNFKIRALIIDKDKIRSDFLRSNRQKFYNYILKQLLEKSMTYLIGSKIFVDGSGTKNIRKELQNYIKRSLFSTENSKMAQIRFVDSKGNNLIQLADLVAGSIRKSCENKNKNDQEYLNKLKKQVENIWFFQ